MNQGGTAGICFFYLSLFNKGRFFIYFNDEGVKTVLNLTLEEVKAYQKDYTAVPVAKECLADMTTPLAFLAPLITSTTLSLALSLTIGS